MLKDSFYKIIKISEISDTEISSEIKLNPNHEIYKGHFPNNPIVPGVVSVQIINEILSEHLENEFMISNAKSIKFTSIINPNINTTLIINIKYSFTEQTSYKINAKIFFKETVFLKFRGIFSIK